MICLPQEATERPAWVCFFFFFFLVQSSDLPLNVSFLLSSSRSSPLPLISRPCKPEQTLLRSGGREGGREASSAVLKFISGAQLGFSKHRLFAFAAQRCEVNLILKICLYRRTSPQDEFQTRRGFSRTLS